MQIDNLITTEALDNYSIRYGETTLGGNYSSNKRYDVTITRAKPADVEADEFIRELFFEARQQVASQIAYDERIEDLMYGNDMRIMSSVELKERLAMIEADKRMMPQHSAMLIEIYNQRIKEEVEEEEKAERAIKEQAQHLQKMIEHVTQLLRDEPFERESRISHTILDNTMQSTWYCLARLIRKKLERQTVEQVANSQVSDWLTDDVKFSLVSF